MLTLAFYGCAFSLLGILVIWLADGRFGQWLERMDDYDNDYHGNGTQTVTDWSEFDWFNDSQENVA